MRLRNFDLFLVVLVVILNVVWTQIPYHLTVVGILLGLPLTLCFPGYTLTQVLFRQREQILGVSNSIIQRPELKIGHPIGVLDQIVLSLGLSLTIDVLVGFVLNIFPIGLQALSWTLSLGLITTLFALVAAFLRRGDIIRVARVSRLHVTMRDGILFALAVVVTAIAVWSSIIRPFDPQPSFTQFRMMPAKNSSCVVSIGVQSFESTPVTYSIIMTVNGTKEDTWSSIALEPQQEWSQSVLVKPDGTSKLYVEAQLYRMDRLGTVYRNVHLTFQVSPESKKGQFLQQCTTTSI